MLGIGGLRALHALDLKPTVWHMNEGHSAFLALERMRLLIEQQNLGFEEAFEACRSNNVFTTHTSVPAGIDLFDPGLMYEYFGEYCRESGMPFDNFLALGRFRPENHQEPFSMAIAAIKTSAFRNAVSCLHRQVSQEMWQELWPKLPVWEVPITSVTNGVHLPTWLNGDLAQLYDQYLQPDWRERYPDPKIWDLVEDIPNPGAVGGAPAAQTEPGHFRAGARGGRGAGAQSLGGRTAAAGGRAGAGRLHHRIRAQIRHLQAGHAAVPRRGAAQAPAHQSASGRCRS